MESKILNCIFIFSSILLFSAVASAQPDTLWTKTYGGHQGEYAKCVQQTTDGGYIVAGSSYSLSPGNDGDVFLIKTDAYGDTLWTKIFGGRESDSAWSVQQTTGGGYIIVGESNSFSMYGPDVYVIKTDSLGNEIWSQLYGGYGEDRGRSIDQTTDGGYIVAGSTNSLSGVSDVYLFKIDSLGNEIWRQTFGGTSYEVALCVQQTIDGGYIVAGTTWSFGAGEYDIYLIKTDAFGELQWEQTFGGTSYDYGYYVQQTSDGGYIIVGQTDSFGFLIDVYLIKTDGFGNERWSQTFSVGIDTYEIGYCVQQTVDGGFVVVGEYWGNGIPYEVYVFKTDEVGNEQWSNIIGGNNWDIGYSIRQTTDNGYIIAGKTWSFGAGSSDIYLIRLEPESPPDLAIILTPENPPIQIPVGGGTFNFNIEIDNSGTTTIAFDVWTMATLPNGNEYGPIIYVENYELSAGQSVYRDRMQYVPMNAPSGNYTYDAYIGNYPNLIWDEDHFEFTKLQVSSGK